MSTNLGIGASANIKDQSLCIRGSRLGVVHSFGRELGGPVCYKEGGGRYTLYWDISQLSASGKKVKLTHFWDINLHF